MASAHEPTFKDLEQQGWIAKASGYAAWLGEITRGAADPLLDATRVTRGTRLLDVASGPGYGAARATARGAKAIGVDFAPAMVEHARRQFPDTEYREGDAENLNFGDSRFDAVTCAFGLLHMADPDRAIAEAARVLAVGGHYAFTVWATPDRHQFFELVLGAIKAHGTLDVPLPPAPSLFRFSDAEECRRALTQAGFDSITVTEIPLVWRCASPQDAVDVIYTSTVRTAMLLERQTPEARESIHRAIIEGTAKFEQDGGYAMDFPAVLVAAHKA